MAVTIDGWTEYIPLILWLHHNAMEPLFLIKKTSARTTMIPCVTRAIGKLRLTPRIPNARIPEKPDKRHVSPIACIIFSAERRR